MEDHKITIEISEGLKETRVFLDGKQINLITEFHAYASVSGKPTIEINMYSPSTFYIDEDELDELNKNISILKSMPYVILNLEEF